MARTLAKAGRVDESLLEGPVWWCPWLAIFAACVAASMALFIPVIRSFWVLPVLAVLIVGSVGAWKGVFGGNAAQRAASVLGILLILGIGGQLATAFFAEELQQGVSSAKSTSGLGDED